eukprot:gene18594-20460_t
MAGMDAISALQQAEDAVSSLYHSRDHFFETHGFDKAKERVTELDKSLKETLKILDKLQFCIENKALYFGLRGKALNVVTEYDAKAVDFLSKAVKLDPSLTEAWNNLGECYWKNRDIDAAKNCFTCALAKIRDKTTLRNLSMVLRQLGKDSVERLANIKESVQIAKEAVSQDLNDGKSWFVLGNAYLSLFFNGGQNPNSLKQAMAAYTKAEMDGVEKNNPDLHFNKAMAYKYQEEYELSLDGFRKAAHLEPDWEDPNNELKTMVSFLQNTKEYIEKKGKLKPKKLQSLTQSIKPSDAGPYYGKEYTRPNGQAVAVEMISLRHLQLGTNEEKIVVGKVAAGIPFDSPVSQPFLLVDAEGNCITVTVYNLGSGKGLNAGDSVAIPEPRVQEKKVKITEDQVLEFQSIRVDNPISLVVNRRKIDASRLAFSVLQLTNKAE